MKYQSHRLITLILLVCLMTLTACVPATPAAEPSVAVPIATAVTPEAATTDAAVDLSNFPVTIENCDRTITFEAPPERVVVNDVNILELFLALDLQDRLVGYSGVREAKNVAPAYQAKLEGIPSLAERYPSLEVLVGADPDFYLAGWYYGLSEESGLTPDTLNPLGIETYAITESCAQIMPRAQFTLEDTFTDLINLGKIVGAEARAQTLVEQYRAELAEIQVMIGDVAEPLRVFVYACCGGPSMLIKAAGGENIFGDLLGNWANVTWEEVVERDPQVIVLADAVWSTAQEKQDFLLNTPTYASIDAVQQQRFIVIPFGATTFGVRNVEGALTLARGLYPDKFQ